MPEKPKPAATRQTLKLQEARIEVARRGRGRALVLLHGMDGHEASSDVVAELAKKYEVILPSMPGFAKSTLPGSITSMDDLSYLYLDLLEQLEIKNATLLGFSVGGWLAAEIATKSCARIARLVLVDALGVKFGGTYDRDIEDIYFHPVETVRAMKFAKPAIDPHADLSRLKKRDAIAVARQREGIAKLCWDPYFHNPALKYRLGRISVPTLVLWGAKDGLVGPAYGRAIAKRIPGARFATVPGAGHYPHIERPDLFLAKLREFLAQRKG
jgi:pimeloyl-ACP methyl ester carboxylesterase